MFIALEYLVALILILTLHEAAHAWVAYRLGDPTAERAGRLSLNPMRHLSFFGTLMLFLAGIGWGKPVPVNPRNFKRPVRDQAITAFAGPAANLILAFLFAIPLRYLPGGEPEWLASFCNAVVDLSLLLFLFNLLPIPPLDGSKFIAIFIPKRFHLTYMDFLQRALPYFVALMVVDIYLFPKLFGFSVVWSVVSQATYWLKTAILVIV